MACHRVAPSHWVGVGTLVLALLLSLAGVGSPWWRMVNGLHVTAYEGLWQQCSSSAESDTLCHFNQESSGLWRAVQVTKLLSLLVLVSAVVMSVVYISGRGRAGRRCPASSMAAWLGGLTSLLADFIYVGFIERHSDHAPEEIVYAWSFALSVAGSIFALFAAFILCLAARYCGPRFTSHLAKPYLPYRHYSVDVDKHGRPQYYLYPGQNYLWSTGKDALPVLNNAPAHLPVVSTSAADKRREFEKRSGRVWFASQGGGYPTGFGPVGLPLGRDTVPPPSPFPDYPGGWRELRGHHGEPRAKRFHRDVPTQVSPQPRGLASSDTSGVAVSVSDKPPLDTSDDMRSPQLGPRPAKRPADRGTMDGRDSSNLVDSGHGSPDDSSRAQSERHDQFSSVAGVVSRLDRDRTREKEAPFTIETVVEPFRYQPEAQSVMYEIDLNEPRTPPGGERLVWQQASPFPSHLPQPSTRQHQDTRRLWLPWTRKPNQSRVVVKTRNGKFVLGSM